MISIEISSGKSSVANDVEMYEKLNTSIKKTMSGNKSESEAGMQIIKKSVRVVIFRTSKIFISNAFFSRIWMRFELVC